MKQTAANDGSISSRLLGAFFRFGRTPWHFVPAAGLSTSETSLLISIDRANRHKQKIRISDLSKFMHVSSPTITQHISNLEAQGFVTKQQAEEDKRAINLTLTDKGREAMEQHFRAMEQNFAELTEILGDEKAELFIEMMQTTNEFFNEKQKSYGDNIFNRR